MSKLYIEKNGLKIPVAELESIASKEQAVIGNAERDLILRTAGNIKIQVGNKFYDLPITTTDVQGGGSGTVINGAKVIIIDNISDLTEITYPGEGSFVYVRDSEDFYIAVSDTYILLTDSKEQFNKIYLSFIDTQDLTGEQKYIAIKNTGLVIDTIQNVGNFDTSDIYENQVVFALAESKHYQLTDVNNPTLTESWKELYLSLTGGTLTGDVYFDKAKVHLKPEYLKDFLPVNESDYDSFFIGDDNYEKGLGIWKTTNDIIFSAQGESTFGYKFLTRGGTDAYLNPLNISYNNVSIAGPIDYNYALSVNGQSIFKNTAYYLNGLSSNNFNTGINGTGFAITLDTLGQYTLEIDKLILRSATTDTDQQYKTRGLDGSLIFNNSYNIITSDPVESIDISILGSSAGKYSDTSGTVMKLDDKSRYATITRIPIANLYDEAPAKVTELFHLGFGIGDKTSSGSAVGYNTFAKQTDGSYATIPGTVISDTINVFQVTVNTTNNNLVVGDLLFYKEWDAAKTQTRAVYAEVVSVTDDYIYLYCYDKSEVVEGDALVKIGNRFNEESFMHMNSSDDHTPFLESANNIESFNDFLENWYYDQNENENTRDRENNTLRKEQIRVKQGLLYGITNVDLGLTPGEQTGFYSDNAYIKGKFQANNRFMLNDILVWDGVTLNLPGYVKETRKLTINGITYDLSEDRAWTIVGEGGSGGTGTVTSVGMTVPTGFSIGNSPISSSGNLVLGYAAGYSLPTTAKQANWDTAFSWGNHAVQGYLKTYTETDPTVPSHVKSITTANIASWNAKQALLVSGTNIKTINGLSILGSGNLTITGGGETLWTQDSQDISPITANLRLTIYGNRPDGSAMALFYNGAAGGQGIIAEAETIAGDFQGHGATLEALRVSNNNGGPIATFTGNANTVVFNNTGTISGFTPTAPNHLTTKDYVDTAVAGAGSGPGGGSVTAVGLTAPTGFTVTNSPITTSGNLTLGFTTGYSLPTTAKQTNWDTAFGWGNHAGRYPLYNGTGATGTWGISINGTAAIGTSWGTSANIYSGTVKTGIDTYLMGYQSGSWGPATQSVVRTFLGLGSNAYTSTAYYPASNPNGYISTYTETDPTVGSHIKAITTTNISNWNTAFGWGNHAGRYPLYNGTGATGTWGINVSGTAQFADKLQLNPVGLLAATFGAYGGILQDSTDGPGTEWTNRIKILHNNNAGYFTELAQRFTGTEGLYHRRMLAGTLTPWRRVLDTFNFNESAPSLTGLNATGTWGINITGTAGNATTWNGQTHSVLLPAIRSEKSTGGGLVNTGTASVGWSARFIAICNGVGTFASAGFFDISVPPNGTVITGVMGASNVTVTSGAIPMSSWSALYYILPIGATFNSVPANFRIASYSTSFDVPWNWVKVVQHNGDNGKYYFMNGVTLGANQTYDTNTYTSAYVQNSANATTWNGQLYNGAAKTGIDNYIMAYQAGVWGPADATVVRNFLGLSFPTRIHREVEQFGVDANVVSGNTTSFTYAANAPYVGTLMTFGSTYPTQFNTNYGAGNLIAFRTYNGDSAAWNTWKSILTQNYNADMVIFGGGSGTSYTNANLQLVRTGEGNPPMLSFHHAGVVASSITIEPTGRISFVNNPGTAYESIIARNINGVGDITAGGNITAGSGVYASNWFRTYGATGWYSETYGGGINMSDTTWVRIYGGKSLLVENTIQTSGSVIAGTGTNGGFANITHAAGHNNIWRFTTSPEYGIGYYQGSSTPTSNVDGIGFHFGDRAAPKFWVNMNGDAKFSRNISAVGGTFTAVVSGVTPTAANHLTTKQYVDSLSGVNYWRREFIGSDWRILPSIDFDGIMLNKNTVGAVIEIQTTTAFAGIRINTGVCTAAIFSNSDVSNPTVSMTNLSTNVNAHITRWIGTNSTLVAYVTTQGVFSSIGGYYDTSDIRLKDVLPYKSINADDITAIRYTFKDRGDKVHYGYSAQEVQKVMPDAITTDTNGILSVNYTQVHTAKIEKLEQEVKQLKLKIKELRNGLD